MIGQCNQCLQEKELHKKSHIIPEFIFKRGKIYDEKDHFLVHFNINSNEEFGRIPSAPYEKYIFCKDCEKYHSAIESKASRAIFHDKFDPSKIHLNEKGWLATNEYEEVDPTELKLFLILLLYRAAISNKNPFIQVRLGPYHEKFRQIINQEKNVSKSGCYFFLYNFKNLINNDKSRLCSSFIRKKVGSKKVYALFVAGIGIIYHFNTPTNNLLKGSEISGVNGTRINLITKKKAARILLKSTFSLPEHIVKEMLYDY